MKRLHTYVQRRSHARLTPQAVRKGWKALLIDARDLASPTEGHTTTYGDIKPRRRGDYAARLVDFEHALREARPAEFPLEGDAIAWAVEGFVRWGRAFVQAPSPEVRAALGPALAAGAEALIDLLDEAVAAQAREHTRRLMGEKGED
jgi:hypothetical protein